MTREATSDMALIAFDSPATHRMRTANRTRRRQAHILLGAGLALLPWLGYLAGTLPPTEAAAWVTLDILEAAALLTAGSRLLSADPRHRAPAAAAAVLLLADACIDITTSAATGTGLDLAVAIAMAVAAELPLAALCAAVAQGRLHAGRRTS